jgi:hypothetical protein
MASNPVWEICERMAECDRHTAADVVAKAQAVLSEPELLRAMLDVGYFPPNTLGRKEARRCHHGLWVCEFLHATGEKLERRDSLRRKPRLHNPYGLPAFS